MKEAFSQSQKVKLNSEENKEQKNQPQKKKQPATKETLQKLVDLNVDISKILYEEDALKILEEKTAESKPKQPKREKVEQIHFEAVTLAEKLNINISESVGTKAVLDSIKQKINELKAEAGHDLEKMAEALSYEVSYKAISTELEVYNNTTKGVGVASLGDYNRQMLNFHINKINKFPR